MFTCFEDGKISGHLFNPREPSGIRKNKYLGQILNEVGSCVVLVGSVFLILKASRCMFTSTCMHFYIPLGLTICACTLYVALNYHKSFCLRMSGFNEMQTDCSLLPS